MQQFLINAKKPDDSSSVEATGSSGTKQDTNPGNKDNIQDEDRSKSQDTKTSPIKDQNSKVPF